MPAAKSARAAKYFQTFPATKRICAGKKGSLQIELHVIGDEQIKIAVVIVIEKSTTGTPAGCARHRQTLLRCNIFETSAAEIAVQNIVAEIRDQHIGHPVVVEIPGADALTPTRRRQA